MKPMSSQYIVMLFLSSRMLLKGDVKTISRVLENVGIDSKKYSGFAFGVGIDRLTMMKYHIDDIRHLYSGGVKIHDALVDSKETELC